MLTDGARARAEAAGHSRAAADCGPLTESHLALQDLAAASKTLDFIQQRAGDSLIAHYYRARIALLKNDYTLAVAECQRALAIDPNHLPSNLMLAAAHVGHGSLEQGEEVLQRLIVSDPQNLAARQLLGPVYLAKGRPDEARRLLEVVRYAAADDAADRLADGHGSHAIRRNGIRSCLPGAQHCSGSPGRSAAARSRRGISFRAPARGTRLASSRGLPGLSDWLQSRRRACGWPAAIAGKDPALPKRRSSG